VVWWKKHPSTAVDHHPPTVHLWQARLSARGCGGAFSASLVRGASLFRMIAALAVLALACPWMRSQAPPAPSVKPVASPTKVAAIKSFRMIQEKDGPAVEILSTLPLVPQIQLINGPTRLVIDLPNARIDMAQKRVNIQADQISRVRANQFQETPPVARVVVDLAAPCTYTWEAAGNRLVVHLGKNATGETESPFEQVTVPSLAPAAPPVIKAVRAAGPLVLASDAGDVGSSFTAGADTAVLRLSSGGELHVCPGTTVSITPSLNRHNLLLGLNTGAVEAHVQLDASTDLVMTPDFRISLTGPGQFHYAFSSDARGDTCVRTLPGNTASAVATELLGNRTYPIQAADQLVFRGGSLDRVDMNVPLECGCPPPRQNIERAANDLASQNQVVSENRPPANPNSMPAETSAPANRTPTSGIATGNEPVKATSESQIQVQVTAPLVFKASGPPPAPVEEVKGSPIATNAATAPAKPAPDLAKTTTTALTVETVSANDPPHGFFHRVRSFFASLFH